MAQRYSLPFFLQNKHHQPRKRRKKSTKSILKYPQTKKCTRCHQIKPLEEFTHDKSSKDGHLRLCRACLRQKTIETRLRWSQEQEQKGPPSHKTCHACKRTLPAEAFHLSKNTKDGLRPTCKACRKAHQVEVQALYQQERLHHTKKEKTCTSCKLTLPITSFYYDKNTKDGYAVYCKKCALRKQEVYVKVWEKRRFATPLHIQKKTCNHCDRTLLINHFSKNRNNSDGYSSACKDCEKERRGALIARWQYEKKPMEKQCMHCKRILPASEFSKSRKARDGLLYMCKNCAAKYYHEMKARWAEERARSQKDFTLFAITEKTCRICQQTLPLSAFYHRKESRDGLTASCKVCDAKRAKQKSKQRKARPKVIPEKSCTIKSVQEKVSLLPYFF